MYLRISLLFSLITVPLLASEGPLFLPVRPFAAGKHLIIVSLGTGEDGKFIELKARKFKVDRDEKLTSLNDLLNKKDGAGDLRIRNNHILFSNTPSRSAFGILD